MPEAWKQLPNLKRLLDEVNARPAQALATRHEFKKDFDEEARKFRFPGNTRLQCGAALLDGRLEQAAELLGELDRYARVHGSLPVEKALAAAQAEHAFMPDVRVDVEALFALEAKADEPLRREVVTWQRERHVEGPPIQRKE